MANLSDNGRTVEHIGAGHARSIHPYVQWGLRDAHGFWVMNRSGKDILRFDSEADAERSAGARLAPPPAMAPGSTEPARTPGDHKTQEEN